jgi:hypothetical protein
MSIKKINIDFHNYDPSLPSDYFLANMLGVFLNFWNEGINQDRLKVLEYDYIVSEKCSITWMGKKKGIITENKEYTFLNQILFLVLDTIRVGYIPTLYRAETWTDFLKYIDNQITEMSNNNYNPIALGYVIPQLNKQRVIITEHLEIGKIITDHDQLNKWIKDFYYMIINWLKDQAIKEKVIDDILADLVKFLIHGKNIDFNQDIISFGIEIIKTKKYTANIDTRIEFAKYVGEQLDKNDQASEQYISSLISVHNDLHNAHIRADYKFMKKLDIYDIIEHMYFNTRPDLVNVLNDDLGMSKKFFNILLMDLSECNDTVDEFCEKIKAENEEEERETVITSLTNVLNYCISSIKFIDKLLTFMMSKPKLINIIKSNEISTVFASIINYMIVMLSTKIKYKLYIKEENLELFMKTLGGILTTFTIIEYDFGHLIDTHNFDIKYYEEFNRHSPYNISGSIDIIKTKILELVKNNEQEIEYPDEFLDPITYTVITDPCLLPDMVGFSGGDVYFDRSTITKQLLIKDENPYTRKPLTIEYFTEFNERPEIIAKLQDFKKRKNSFIM